jgi:cytochrome c biogenesis protein CcmG/thiol:disulfide interchange protein DsbE
VRRTLLAILLQIGKKVGCGCSALEGLAASSNSLLRFTPAAEAESEKRPLIAAVNRCATQNQNQTLNQNQIPKQNQTSNQNQASSQVRNRVQTRGQNRAQSQVQNRSFRASFKRCPKISPCFSTICAAIGLLAALSGCYSGGHPTRIGSTAPDFTVQDSDHAVTLSQFRGQVVVLNFWATWCPPCIEETPSLVQMQARLKDKGVVVLAVSIDADDAEYHKFLKNYNVNMVTVRDEPRKASSLYGTFGWPETYIIDRHGLIRRKFIGAVDWNSPEIVDYLKKL